LFLVSLFACLCVVLFGGGGVSLVVRCTANRQPLSINSIFPCVHMPTTTILVYYRYMWTYFLS
jgi:hypothetical protein